VSEGDLETPTMRRSTPTEAVEPLKIIFVRMDSIAEDNYKKNVQFIVVFSVWTPSVGSTVFRINRND
jgi:hypothetical protein